MINELKKERKLAGSNKIPNINPTNIGFGIKTYVPTIDYYLDLIKDGTNFKFIRCNHGLLDPFARSMSNDELNEKISNKQYRELAEKVAEYHAHHHPQLKRWHGDMNEKYVDILTFFTQFFYDEIHNKDSEFDFGISLCNGIWRASDNVEHKDVISRGNAFLSLTQNLDKIYFHGGLARHYAVTGEIFQLFDLLNELDYDVIFVGAPYFKIAEAVYNIKNFIHIPISYTNAIKKFDETIDILKNTIKKRETIIFNSCGHDLTFYLADKIRGIDVSQMDVGRALDWNMNKSFIRKEHTEAFNNLPNGIYKPWEQYGENPWLTWARPTHMNVVKRLRQNNE